MTALQVGRIGRAHGIRGEVTVTPFTDDRAARFAVGSQLRTDSVTRPELTVSSARQSGPVQVVGTVLLMAAVTTGLAVVSAAVYRRSVLRTGSRVRWREALRRS